MQFDTNHIFAIEASKTKILRPHFLPDAKQIMRKNDIQKTVKNVGTNGALKGTGKMFVLKPTLIYRSGIKNDKNEKTILAYFFICVFILTIPSLPF